MRSSGRIECAAAPAKKGGGALKMLFWQAPTLLNPHFAVGVRLRGERRRGQACGGPQRRQPESSQRHWMPGSAKKGTKDGRDETPPVLHRPSDESLVGIPVSAERRSCGIERPLQHDRPAVGQRMGQGRGRVNQLQAMLAERESSKERRAGSHRVDRRDVGTYPPANV